MLLRAEREAGGRYGYEYSETNHLSGFFVSRVGFRSLALLVEPLMDWAVSGTNPPVTCLCSVCLAEPPLCDEKWNYLHCSEALRDQLWGCSRPC